MDTRPDPAKLKEEILAKVAEYHAAVHGQELPFIPGKTKVNYAGRHFDKEEMLNLVDSSLEFWLTWGHWSAQFEKEFSKFLGVRWSFIVNSGSSANLLAFMALTSPLLGGRRIERGDEVIGVATAFPTTVAPIVQYGAVPVFVDVDLKSANIDCSLLEKALSPKTKAVMLAHTLGNPFDVKKVKAFCEKNKLWLVEDNCDALGSKLADRFTGSFGDIGTSSFYPPHHITMGEGGAVYTSNPALRKIILSLRDWGRDCYCDSGRDNTCGCRFSGQFGSLPKGYDHKYVYSHLGYNLKATDMQAAIGCAQLAKLPSFIKRRRENFAYLKAKLENLTQIQIMEPCPEAEPSWFGFLITLKDGSKVSRNELVKALESKKIQTRTLFAGNLTRHPCFESLKEGVDYRIASPLGNTDKIMNDSFWIGVYPGMTPAMLDFMADSISGAF